MQTKEEKAKKMLTYWENVWLELKVHMDLQEWIDTDFWSKILCNSTFGNASDDPCHAIALLVWMLCSEELVDPKSIEELVACWLIPLDKSPGVRPIGVGELFRRIISKAILTVSKSYILNVIGYTNNYTYVYNKDAK